MTLSELALRQRPSGRPAACGVFSRSTSSLAFPQAMLIAISRLFGKPDLPTKKKWSKIAESCLSHYQRDRDSDCKNLNARKFLNLCKFRRTRVLHGVVIRNERCARGAVVPFV